MRTYGKKTFGSRKDLMAFIIANKEFEIAKRKASIKYSDPAILSPLVLEKVLSKGANKAVLFSDDLKNGVAERTLLVNTYLWRDSHWDVHLPGTFTRSIDQKGNKVLPIDQHRFDLDHIIGSTISVKELPFDWKALGVEKDGQTTGVVAEAAILQSKSPKRFQDYIDNTINQHSVGMYYVKASCAVDDEDYPNEYELYKKWIDQIGNQEIVEEDGFFFAVSEAKLVEYSPVIAGSNELTPVLYPSKDTTGNEYQDPSEDTLKAINDLANKLELRNQLSILNLKLNGKEY
jgi:hypothetical protein